MKYNIKKQGMLVLGPLLLLTFFISSCKKSVLDTVTYGAFAESFPVNESEAREAGNFCYTGMLQQTEWSLDYSVMRPMALATTDELIVNWNWEGLRTFSYFNPDNFLVPNRHFSSPERYSSYCLSYR